MKICLTVLRIHITTIILLVGALAKAQSSPLYEISSWYKVFELRKNLYLVREPAEASFFILKDNDLGLLIDSGLGIDIVAAKELFQKIGIKKFKVLNTHAHCDHIGLNSLATKVYIDKTEWLKFQKHGDQNQIGFYYELLKNDVPWPKSLKSTPKQKKWNPTNFIQKKQVISFGKWNLEAISVPGHTSGHTAFLDKKEKILFLGDFVYDGTLYLHMPDSSLKAFDTSLKKIESIVMENSDITLLPAHNSIPLKAEYISTIRSVLEKIKVGELKPTGDWKADSIFVDAKTFESNNVKMAVKLEDLRAFRPSN